MQLIIRAHDMEVKGTQALLNRLEELGLDGVQMVCYKAYDDIPYVPGGITAEKADAIGKAFADAGKTIPLVGAYFNPVHSQQEKRENGFNVFAEYLKYARRMGCKTVGSETGSFNDDQWTYNPQNRTEEALQRVAATFSRLCDIGADYGCDVAMEGSIGHVCWTPEALDQVQKMMNRKNLKVIFDLYNYIDGTNQAEYLNILDRGLDLFAGRIHAFHIKDCRFVNGGEPWQVPFGTGDMDITAVLSKIKNYDKDALLVLEGTTGEFILPAAQKIKTIWESN